MFRTLSIAAALAATALPAFADPASVSINVAGLTDKAVHAAIVQAAQAACREELATSSLTVQFYARPGCVNETVARAETKLAQMHGALASR
jgi:hypothetical protein